MSHDVSLQLILNELKGCRRQIDTLVNDVATLKAADNEQSQSVQKFWAENWAPLKSDIADIKNRLSTLEQGDFKDFEKRLDKTESDNRLITDANLSKRLAKLETNEARKQGMAAAAGMLGGGTIAALFRWILGGS